MPGGGTLPEIWTLNLIPELELILPGRQTRQDTSEHNTLLLPDWCLAFTLFMSKLYLPTVIWVYCLVWASRVAQTVKNLPAMQEIWV